MDCLCLSVFIRLLREGMPKDFVPCYRSGPKLALSLALTSTFCGAIDLMQGDWRYQVYFFFTLVFPIAARLLFHEESPKVRTGAVT